MGVGRRRPEPEKASSTTHWVLRVTSRSTGMGREDPGGSAQVMGGSITL